MRNIRNSNLHTYDCERWPDPPWANISPAERYVLEQYCTERQIQAYRLHRSGLGLRVIALALGITREAVRDRIRAAERHLNQHRKVI